MPSDDNKHPCPNGTDGMMICRSCNGTPTRWIPPTTESGSPTLWTCPACNGSGRVQCMTCSGSGYVTW